MFWLLAVFVATAAASAALVPRLGDNAPLYLVLPPMFLCILSCWGLAFENNGMQRSRGWGEHLLYGFFKPSWSNWAKPVELSFNGYVVVLSAAVMVGALLRMLWAVYA